MDRHDDWHHSWGRERHRRHLTVPPEQLDAVFSTLSERLRENYPFFHPRYAGQMLKPPHPVAMAGYLAAMPINPNNHALDGGPATAAMEKEVVARPGGDVRLPGDTPRPPDLQRHDRQPRGALGRPPARTPARRSPTAHDAHYTHARMCEVLGVESVAVPADAAGPDGPGRPGAAAGVGRVGTVVADRRHHRPRRRRPGGRGPGAAATATAAGVHADAAYGGFFTLLAADTTGPALGPEVAARLRAMAACDSVVVDPHKHGLQPYGCGAVLFRDPAVGRLYRHDSPYTYFTSDELHLGEISLECSRAGAAAAALWATCSCLPLEPEDGLGAILAAPAPRPSAGPT